VPALRITSGSSGNLSGSTTERDGGSRPACGLGPDRV